jgi:carbonic anhydrase
LGDDLSTAENNAFADVLEANALYANSFGLSGLDARASKGLGVLTCIDSRMEPLAMLGLKPGDAKILRNAGARATDDALRSLVLATNLLGVSRVMVVAHTDCALANTSDNDLRERVRENVHANADLDALEIHAMPDPHAALVADVERIRNCPMLPPQVVVAGFEYDVDSGLLRSVT